MGKLVSSFDERVPIDGRFIPVWYAISLAVTLIVLTVGWTGIVGDDLILATLSALGFLSGLKGIRTD